MSGKRKCDMDGFCADCGLPLMKEDYRFCRRCEHRGMPVANPGNHRLKMIHNPPSWKQEGGQ